MFSVARKSLPAVALCFAMAATTHGNDRGGGQAQQLQHLDTTAEQSSPGSRATLIPLSDEARPAGSVVAAAIWGARDDTDNTDNADNTDNTGNKDNALQLPQLQSEPGTDEGISSRIGTKLQQELQSRRQRLLTPRGLVDAMKQVDGINIQESIQESATAMGTQLSQEVIDSGLRKVESSVSPRFFRTLNLSWSPGFNQREDVYQIDSMMSLYDGQVGSLMTQVGIQSRNSEPAANVGMILRNRAFRDWVFGLNTFYDYLSDPQVDRWSVGAEIYGRWFTVTSNVYTGMDEDVVLGQRWYSPDGWDIEFAGRAAQLPWLEYSGRYYNWDIAGGRDLKGQDYKLTLKPVQLLDLSLRYDDASGGGGELGVEAQFKYQFGVSLREQNSISNVAVPSDPWQRRFERVRREYEQRAQQRRDTGSSVSQVGSTTCSGANCSATFNVTGITASEVVITVSSIPGTLPEAGTGTAAASSSTSSLLRVSGTGTGCRISTDENEIPATVVTAVSCSYSGNSITVDITQSDVGSFIYDLEIEFQDSTGTAIGSLVRTTLEVEVIDLRGATSSAPGGLTVSEGSSNTYTLRLTSAPTGGSAVLTLSSDNSDVTFTPQTLTFTASNFSATQTVTVSAAEDDDSNDDTAQLSYTVSGGSNYDSFTVPAQSVTVEDNDSASVRVSADSMTMPETGGTVTVTFTLSNPATGNVIIDIDTAGSATRDTDYRLSATRLTLDNSNPPTSLTGSITVTAITDSADEGSETIELTYTITGSGAGDITDPDGITLTITEGPAVTVRSSSSSMDEEGNNNSVTLNFTLNNFVGFRKCDSYCRHPYRQCHVDR